MSNTYGVQRTSSGGRRIQADPPNPLEYVDRSRMLEIMTTLNQRYEQNQISLPEIRQQLEQLKRQFQVEARQDRWPLLATSIMAYHTFLEIASMGMQYVGQRIDDAYDQEILPESTANDALVMQF